MKRTHRSSHKRRYKLKIDSFTPDTPYRSPRQCEGEWTVYSVEASCSLVHGVAVRCLIGRLTSSGPEYHTYFRCAEVVHLLLTEKVNGLLPLHINVQIGDGGEVTVWAYEPDGGCLCE